MEKHTSLVYTLYFYLFLQLTNKHVILRSLPARTMLGPFLVHSTLCPIPMESARAGKYLGSLNKS